jgi:hypothetical protein
VKLDWAGKYRGWGGLERGLRGDYVSGLQPSDTLAGFYLGLRPRLVCVGPLALKADGMDLRTRSGSYGGASQERIVWRCEPGADCHWCGFEADCMAVLLGSVWVLLSCRTGARAGLSTDRIQMRLPCGSGLVERRRF